MNSTNLLAIATLKKPLHSPILPAYIMAVAVFGLVACGAAKAQLCKSDIDSGDQYECEVAAISSDKNEGEATRYWLKDAPVGMSIQPRSGILRWSPLKTQAGEHQVRIIRKAGSHKNTVKQTFNVAEAANGARQGWFVAPNGNDADSGKPSAPLATITEAAARAEAGDTIYLRGGAYHNPGYGEPAANRDDSTYHVGRITRSGKAGSPITLRPHGNEFVKIHGDRAGLLFREVSHWVVRDMEFEGNAQAIDENDVMPLWWKDGRDVAHLTGRGVHLQKSFDITVQNCVIHDWPGAGISNNFGSGSKLIGNAVYNNGWWSTGGVHGVSNSKLQDHSDDSSAEAKKVVHTIHGNLVYGNQSSVISHVFSKGFTTLEIDEGNGLHLQNNASLYSGSYSVRNNLVMFNGKAGIGLNTIDGGVIANNSFYQNAQAVNTGELAVQTSKPERVARNLFHPQAHRKTIKNSAETLNGAHRNYTVAATDSDKLPASFHQVDAVFSDPDALNFMPATGIPQHQGISAESHDHIMELIHVYGLKPAPAPTIVDEEYVHGLKQRIMDNWPNPDSADGLKPGYRLVDKHNGFTYRYATRHCFPNKPEESCTSR